MDEDDIEVEFIEDSEKILKPYRANRYIKEYYKTQDKLTEELLSKKIITYNSIGQVLGASGTIVKNAMTKETKNPQPSVRRGLDMFFGKDLYEKELGSYNKKCIECTKRCKQHYWVEVVHCSMYDKK